MDFSHTAGNVSRLSLAFRFSLFLPGYHIRDIWFNCLDVFSDLAIFIRDIRGTEINAIFAMVSFRFFIAFSFANCF
jgi:hypothetical protein